MELNGDQLSRSQVGLGVNRIATRGHGLLIHDASGVT